MSRSTPRTARCGIRSGSAQGLAKLKRAVRLRRPGEYQLQAAITSLQIQAPDAEGHRLGADRRALRRPRRSLNPSPVIELNRAVAVSLADGPAMGLELLKPLLDLPALKRYQPLHAAHADLLRRAGNATDAARAYERAIALTTNDIEREELEHGAAANWAERHEAIALT